MGSLAPLLGLLAFAAAPACHSGTERTASGRGFKRCDHGVCEPGFTCRYDRAPDGGMQELCVPEIGRCRFSTDCPPSMQRCVRARPGALGVCWDRAM